MAGWAGEVYKPLMCGGLLGSLVEESSEIDSEALEFFSADLRDVMM